MTNLEILYLSGNQLSRSIPGELGSLTNLDYLTLNNNQLSGTIPGELGNLTNLTVLHLRNNQLAGAIPRELGNLTNLTSLSLRGNQLSGAIPGELGRLTNLEVLYLHNNQLSGTIPGELGGLTNLTVLLLNGNQLTGCIPIDLADTERHDLYEIGLPFCGALEVPVIVTPIKAGVSTLTVSWVPPTDTGDQIITGYSLRYIRADADDTVEGNSTIVGYARNYSRLLRHVITGLAPATEYKVQVRAVKITGDLWSAAATVTTEWGAVRSFQSVFVDPGSNVEVTIVVRGYGANGEVVETLPDGFSYQSSNLRETSVKVTGREVRFGFSGVETFTYTVTAASIEGPYGLHGWIINAAKMRREVIGGSILVVSNAPRASVTASTETLVRLDLPIAVTVTFSEPVSGFTIDDIDLANGVVSNFAGSGAVYTFDVTPNAIGEVTVDIAAGAAMDADGYDNMAAPTLLLGIPYDGDHDGGMSKEEAITAVIDYFSGRITKSEAIAVIILYFSG